ncbi:MAG: RDD family protein [Bacteroidota bacterium]
MEPNAIATKAGFWRRIAAGWIDAFIIFVITNFIIEFLALLSFRISFGTLFLINGAVYSYILLSRFRQTPGKMIMKVYLSDRYDESLSKRNILLREVFGKWGVTLALPMMLAIILGGNTYLPTYTDILVLIFSVAVCTIWYLFTRQMWYDRMAGLTAEYHRQAKKSKTAFIVLVTAAIIGGGMAFSQYIVMHRIPCRLALYRNINSVKPYVRFLKKQKTNPVDYVIGLFEKYDVVVLCERAHPEMTQYDFVFNIVKDPRFISKAGMVFSEIGQKGMQEYMDNFMNTDSLSDSQIREHILQITRNAAVHPAWSNYNWYQYIERLYKLNRTLPPDKRVRYYFTDSPVNWNAIKNQKDYTEYQHKYVWNRDSLMAQTVIDAMSGRNATDSTHKKCLVIMNYRHAFDLTDRDPNTARGNTFEYIKDALGDRAANVLINDRVITIYPPAGGLWEEAFQKTGNKPAGFDFRGSPFGADNFDMYPWDIAIKRNFGSRTQSAEGLLRYRDVFTGFVFINPAEELYWQQSTPGYYDGFEKEYIRRCGCVNAEYIDPAKQQMADIKTSGDEPVVKYSEYQYETLVSLFLYCFFGIGLITGLIAFAFQKVQRKGL